MSATLSDLLDRAGAVHFFASGCYEPAEAGLRRRHHRDDTDRPALMAGTTFRNGMPLLKPYVYRGTGQDELTAWMDDLPDEAPAGPGRAASSPCGTSAAYRRHRRRGEQACAACLAAERSRNAGRKNLRSAA
jgi:hypothetical protein